MKNRRRSLGGASLAAVLAAAPLCGNAAHPVVNPSSPSPSPASGDQATTMPEVVVSATRTPLETERSPSAVTVITSEEMEKKQLRFVSDALRTVPGVSLVQTGAPGQLTSAFIRGVTSEGTQVMLDGVPINQGLAGMFNFADLTTVNLDRIEVVRGPQSALYGPRAGGGVINLISKRGTRDFETSFTGEAGSFNSVREIASTVGQAGILDYSVGVSRFDTNGDRRNSEYRGTNGLMNVGITPAPGLRLFTVASYSLSDASSPGSIFAPRYTDNLLTERWLVAPGIEWQATDWWKHRLITDYDEERQVNKPNLDGFVGDTRGSFKRYQLDYQNEITFCRGAKLTSGFFYSRVEAEQERPFTLFGPTWIGDKTENYAAFGQLQLEPVENLLLVAGGRWDHFSQFGDISTYRVAGSYKLPWTGTVVRSSVGTGFLPASPQDKIFGNNFDLEPNKTRGFDIGFEQGLWNDRVRFGANYFHNKMSNVIGYDGMFQTLNLGAAEAKGAEVFLTVSPVADLNITANYTYLDTEKTSSNDIQQPKGARLPRRPRNEFYVSVNYLWFKRLRTGVDLKYVNGREELSFGGPNFDIEDYTTVRLWAEYQVCKNCTVFGRVENLTGEKYAEVYGYPNPGRAFYGGLTLRF